MVWVHPKTIKTVSSTTGALVGVGSLKPLDKAFYFLNYPHKNARILFSQKEQLFVNKGI
jgi:hypothetical protein